MAINKIKGDAKLKEQRLERQKKRKKVPDVSIDDQMRLAEILNDSPTLVALNGTPFEVRALRYGTQWRIAQKVLEITKAEEGSFGDILKHFAQSVPAVLEVLTLALLNDKNKIFKDGDETAGYSDLFKATYSTLEWECDYTKFGEILITVLSKLDISFFMESLGMLDIFRQKTTAKKRMRTKSQQQK